MSKLALYGGAPVRTKPWVSKYMGSEELGEEEKARVLKVLEKKGFSAISLPVSKIRNAAHWKTSIKAF